MAAVLGIGLGALISGISANHYATDPTVHINWNPTDRSLRSLAIAQLAFAILGVMVVTGEYSTGHDPDQPGGGSQARPAAGGQGAGVDRAWRWSPARSSASSPSSSVRPSSPARLPPPPSASHDVLRAVIGAGLYLALLGLLGTAVGVLLRHAAAAIGTMVALLLVLPGIASALPASWSNPIEQWWPTNAGQQVAVIVRDAHTLPAWTGLARHGGIRGGGADRRLRDARASGRLNDRPSSQGAARGAAPQRASPVWSAGRLRRPPPGFDT